MNEGLTKLATCLADRSADVLAGVCAAFVSREHLETFLVDLEAMETEVREDFAEEQIGPVDGFELDYGSTDVDSLRESGIDLHAEISDDNFLGWGCVQLLAEEGEWALADVWAAVVKENGQPVIGHLLVESPD